MAYFNHAFQKAFLGTAGFVSTVDITSGALTKGQFAFVDPKTWKVPADVDAASALKCPLVLAAGSLYQNDKIGPYHGGYKESSKSKLINPKYVTSFYRVDPCPLQQTQVTVGANLDSYETASCTKEFICGETYNLRVDMKGSPALRTLTRNSYYTAAAYTGCCPEGELAPTAVNPLIVYVQWAYQLLNSPLVNPFIQVEVTYNTLGDGVLWLELGDGTSSQANLDLLLGYIQDPSTLPGTAASLAGIIINGAYEDTQFGNCTFYPNDSVISYLEPIKVLASEVDLNGDPCAFQGLCINTSCEPIQGTGWGETVVRDLILTQGYEQAPFYTGKDLRIREITQGYDVTDSVNRLAPNNQYYRYYIQHSVPRLNNPSGTFDNDQYLLEIITDQVETTFEDFVSDWLTNAGSGCELDAGGPKVYDCPEVCTPIAPTND